MRSMSLTLKQKILGAVQNDNAEETGDIARSEGLGL